MVKNEAICLVFRQKLRDFLHSAMKKRPVRGALVDGYYALRFFIALRHVYVIRTPIKGHSPIRMQNQTRE